MADTTTLFWLFAAGCFLVPAAICAFCGPVENNSRAIKNDPRRFSNRNSIISEGE